MPTGRFSRCRMFPCTGLDLVVNLSPPLDHKLIQLGNVLVTPHTAFFSQEAVLGRTRAVLS